jgi:hypothetical protein
MSVLIEFKASDFNAMKTENIVANLDDHAAQLYRYLASPEVADVSTDGAMMYVVYPERPGDPDRLAIIESKLADHGITPVWAEDYFGYAADDEGSAS